MDYVFTLKYVENTFGAWFALKEVSKLRRYDILFVCNQVCMFICSIFSSLNMSIMKFDSDQHAHLDEFRGLFYILFYQVIFFSSLFVI